MRTGYRRVDPRVAPIERRVLDSAQRQTVGHQRHTKIIGVSDWLVQPPHPRPLHIAPMLGIHHVTRLVEPTLHRLHRRQALGSRMARLIRLAPPVHRDSALPPSSAAAPGHLLLTSLVGARRCLLVQFRHQPQRPNK